MQATLANQGVEYDLIAQEVESAEYRRCWSAYVQLQPGSLDSLILRQVVVKRLRIRANYQRVYIHRREV